MVEDPMTEIRFLFLQSNLPSLNRTNKFLQALVHLLQPQLFSLVRKILSKFVTFCFSAES